MVKVFLEELSLKLEDQFSKISSKVSVPIGQQWVWLKFGEEEEEERHQGLNHIATVESIIVDKDQVRALIKKYEEKKPSPHQTQRRFSFKWLGSLFFSFFSIKALL